MPKISRKDNISQAEVDAFDLAINGIDSDVFKHPTMFKMTQGKATYHKRKEDLTLTDLMSILSDTNGIEITETLITTTKYNRLKSLFSDFPVKAEKIGVLSIRMENAKSEIHRIAKRNEKRRTFTRRIRWLKWITGGAFAAYIVFLGALDPAMWLQALLLLYFFGAMGYIIGLGISSLLNIIFGEPRLKEEALTHYPTNDGFITENQKKISALLESHPKFASTKFSDFENLHEYLMGEAELTDVKEKVVVTEEMIAQVEQELQNRKYEKAREGEEPVMSIEQVFQKYGKQKRQKTRRRRR